MEGYDAVTYGEALAGVYDEWYPVPDEAAVDLLADLAGDGPALELGIGTGRVALPLAARGVDVRGIEISAAMVERLRAKRGGKRIPVTVGDFAGAEVEGDGTFSLVFVVANTLFQLLTQEEQLRCVSRAAARLRPGGLFLVEAFVADLTWWRNDQAVEVLDVEVDRVVLEASRHDPVEQRIDGAYVDLADGSVRVYPMRMRYVWPSELDLMAALGGLRRRDRWGGWDRTPFSSVSARHVSVYEKR